VAGVGTDCRFCSAHPSLHRAVGREWLHAAVRAATLSMVGGTASSPCGWVAARCGAPGERRQADRSVRK